MKTKIYLIRINFLLALFLFIFSLATNLLAQYPNIQIGNQYEPNEPSICINPKNPLQMVCGANSDNYYYSTDGGITWNSGILTSSMGVYGDPVVIADTAGNFYYFHLSDPTGPEWLDRVVCQKSVNGGQTWNDGSFMGLNGTKDQDKEWAVVNTLNNEIYTCWTQFDKYGSAAILDSTCILFSSSADGGITWTNAKRINRVDGDCLDTDNTVEGAVPAVGPVGEVYVSWAGPAGLVFTKSTDGGITWPDGNIFIGNIPGGWAFTVPGMSRANGLPVTCCDLSNGPHRGTIYINWSDQRNGTTDTDIWVVKSTDGGLNWSMPKRVNDDPPGRHQFLTWMTVDQFTGFIYFVFYDRRNYTDNKTDVYMAVSRDGGESFRNFIVSEAPFTPNASLFFGDYTNIAASNNIVRPVWTSRSQGVNLCILTALVDSIYYGISPEKEKLLPFSLDQNFPNPVQDITYFSYKVHAPANVSLKVYDIYGNEVAVILSNISVSPGKHIEQFDRSNYGLAPGLYFFSLTGNDIALKRKMVVY
ncbi:MAG: T9SS type A sorting domain-containing protein [Bacteroidetes bacterium]|nr:T9SS type A sorting domain-containing protein [Bacteroidota bacterium]